MKLNLGCGADLREGYINCDYGDREGYGDNQVTQFKSVNLTCYPWPWKDGTVDEVLMWHVLEHLSDTTGVIREIHRILKPAGVFWGQVPFAFSDLSWAQFDHEKHFTDKTFHGMKHFGFTVETSLGTHSMHLQHRIRNLIPLRSVLCRFLFNMDDVVNFKMTKV